VRIRTYGFPRSQVRVGAGLTGMAGNPWVHVFSHSFSWFVHAQHKQHNCALTLKQVIQHAFETTRTQVQLYHMQLRKVEDMTYSACKIGLFRPGLARKPQLWLSKIQAKAINCGLALAWPGLGHGFVCKNNLLLLFNIQKVRRGPEHDTVGVIALWGMAFSVTSLLRLPCLFAICV
jgi:hypothetical protein